MLQPRLPRTRSTLVQGPLVAAAEEVQAQVRFLGSAFWSCCIFLFLRPHSTRQSESPCLSLACLVVFFFCFLPFIAQLAQVPPYPV